MADYTALAEQARQQPEASGPKDYSGLADRARTYTINPSPSFDRPGQIPTPAPGGKPEPFHAPRFLEALWDSTLGALPAAAKEFYNRPAERNKIFAALEVSSRAKKEGRAMTPEEQKIFDAGGSAQVAAPLDPMVPQGTEPGLAAADMARTGDWQGAAGTVLGAYGVPGAIAAAGGRRVEAPLRNPNPVKAAAVDAALERGDPVPVGRRGLVGRQEARRGAP